MILITLATALSLTQGAQEELPKPAELQSGEVVRLYERSLGRRLFENTLVLTHNKAFIINGEKRGWTMLTTDQQVELGGILQKEPEGLKAKRRDKPMWPSSYDAQDIWMTYRLGKTVQLWTNYEFEYPTGKCPLTKLIEDVKAKLTADMIKRDGAGLPNRTIPITKDGGGSQKLP